MVNLYLFLMQISSKSNPINVFLIAGLIRKEIFRLAVGHMDTPHRKHVFKMGEKQRTSSSDESAGCVLVIVLHIPVNMD